MASDILERCKKPVDESALGECEYISIMKGAYFQPPKQIKTLCEGYKNQYTNEASYVCQSCQWFSKNGGVSLNDRNGTD